MQNLVIAAAAVLAPCVVGVAPPQVSPPRWTTAAGVRIRYFEAGNGPPMLLLHGSLTHWSGDDADLESLLPKIKAPTLIVWGSDDPIWPRATANEYARRIRGARIAIVENAGHAPYLERPASFVDAVLRPVP